MVESEAELAMPVVGNLRRFQFGEHRQQKAANIFGIRNGAFVGAAHVENPTAEDDACAVGGGAVVGDDALATSQHLPLGHQAVHDLHGQLFGCDQAASHRNDTALQVWQKRATIAVRSKQDLLRRNCPRADFEGKSPVFSLQV